MDHTATAVIVLLGLALLRFVVLSVGAALILRAVKACPACFEPTFVLQRRWLQRLLPWLEVRFCPHCGWQGPARRERVVVREPRQRRRAGQPTDGRH